jgi:hypothetical protein
MVLALDESNHIKGGQGWQLLRLSNRVQRFYLTLTLKYAYTEFVGEVKHAFRLFRPQHSRLNFGERILPKACFSPTPRGWDGFLFSH